MSQTEPGRREDRISEDMEIRALADRLEYGWRHMSGCEHGDLKRAADKLRTLLAALHAAAEDTAQQQGQRIDVIAEIHDRLIDHRLGRSAKVASWDDIEYLLVTRTKAEDTRPTSQAQAATLMQTWMDEDRAAPLSEMLMEPEDTARQPADLTALVQTQQKDMRASLDRWNAANHEANRPSSRYSALKQQIDELKQKQTNSAGHVERLQDWLEAEQKAHQETIQERDFLKLQSTKA